MRDGPPDDLLAAIDADPPAAPGDRIAQLRASCEELREVAGEINDLERRLDDARARRAKLRTESIPDQMDMCGVGALDLLARGNWPAVRVEVRPEVRACVAASWDDARKRAALDWLDGDGSGDLIKTVLTVRFPREERVRALEVAAGLRQLRLSVDLEESVHAQTLSAWLRQRLRRPENNRPVPLDVIGGYAGRVAEIKPLDKEKLR